MKVINTGFTQKSIVRACREHSHSVLQNVCKLLGSSARWQIRSKDNKLPNVFRNLTLEIRNSFCGSGLIMFNLLRFASHKRGFTLIELLVVVAIIGILSTLATANVLTIRQRTRDTQRKADLRQIQAALEFYRADVSTYPQTSSLSPSPFSTCGGAFQNGTKIYMKKIPCDPSTSTGYIYSSSNGSTYDLVTCLENPNDPQKDASNNSSCTGGKVSYTLQNP